MLRRGSTRSGMVGRPQAQKLLDPELQVPARVAASFGRPQEALAQEVRQQQVERHAQVVGADIEEPARGPGEAVRSEEHTSELQSLMRISYAVFCLKKKKNHKNNTI